MKLTIVAATGGIGRQLLEQALAAGHDVTAVARNPGRLPPVPARAVTADLASADPAALRGAVEGADAVLSGLGARSKAEAGVAWRGTWALTQAMRAAGVGRIVVVSAAPVGAVPSPARPHPPRHDPGDGFLLPTWPIRSCARRCGTTTPTWPGWRTSCARLTWTGPRSARLG